MSSYEIGNDDKIKSALIKVQALKEEYEVTLQQYREAGQNFITILQREKLLNPKELNAERIFSSLQNTSFHCLATTKSLIFVTSSSSFSHSENFPNNEVNFSAKITARSSSGCTKECSTFSSSLKGIGDG